MANLFVEEIKKIEYYVNKFTLDADLAKIELWLIKSNFNNQILIETHNTNFKWFVQIIKANELGVFSILECVCICYLFFLVEPHDYSHTSLRC